MSFGLNLETAEKVTGCESQIPPALRHLSCINIKEFIYNGRYANTWLVGYGREGLGIRIDPTDEAGTPLLLKLFTRAGVSKSTMEQVVSNLNLAPNLVSVDGIHIDEGNISTFTPQMIDPYNDFDNETETAIRKKTVLRQAMAYHIARGVNWEALGMNNPIPQIHELVSDDSGHPLGFIADFVPGNPIKHAQVEGFISTVRQIQLPNKVIVDTFGTGNILMGNQGPMVIDLKYLGQL